MSYLLTYLLTRVSSPRCSVSSSKSDCGRLLSGVFACFVRFFRHLVQIAKKNIKNYKNVNPLFLYFLTRAALAFLISCYTIYHLYTRPSLIVFFFDLGSAYRSAVILTLRTTKEEKKHTSKKPPLSRLYARLPFEIGKAQLGSFPEMAPKSQFLSVNKSPIPGLVFLPEQRYLA